MFLLRTSEKTSVAAFCRELVEPQGRRTRRQMSSRSDDAADQPPSVVSRSALDKTPIAPGSENFESEIRTAGNPTRRTESIEVNTPLVGRTGAVADFGRSCLPSRTSWPPPRITTTPAGMNSNVSPWSGCAPEPEGASPYGEGPFRQKGPTKHSPFRQNGPTITNIRDCTEDELSPW